MTKRRKPDGARKKMNRNALALGWLGGPALFGFVSCQTPDSPAADAVKPKDSVEAVRQPPVGQPVDTVPGVVKTDTVPIGGMEPVPTPDPEGPMQAGRPCDSLAYPGYYCDAERVILACRGGTMIKASPPVSQSGMAEVVYVCHTGLSEPIPEIRTMGFNGSDAADRALSLPGSFIRERIDRRRAS